MLRSAEKLFKHQKAIHTIELFCDPYHYALNEAASEIFVKSPLKYLALFSCFCFPMGPMVFARDQPSGSPSNRLKTNKYFTMEQIKPQQNVLCGK